MKEDKLESIDFEQLIFDFFFVICSNSEMRSAIELRGCSSYFQITKLIMVKPKCATIFLHDQKKPNRHKEFQSLDK